MITVFQKHEMEYVGYCNSCCNHRADMEIKFHSEYAGGGTVISLCKDCADELSKRLPMQRDSDMNENFDRAVTLLRAAEALLEKQKKSYYVLNLLEEEVFYDDDWCDGDCLLEDIKYLLEEIECEKD